MANNTIRVVVVDDHPLFREGVVNTLETNPDFEVVEQGDSAEDAVKLAKEFLPDIILLDITMPGGGIKATQTVSTICPVTKVVILTVSEDDDDVMTALKSGARGYILKGVGGAQLQSILKDIYNGEIFITPELAAGVLLDLATPKEDVGTDTLKKANPLEELTKRERQILELVGKGQTNKSIGKQLGITEKTVKHYMSNILAKLHVRNRVEAALLAHKLSK